MSEDPDYDRSICTACAAQFSASGLRPYRIGDEASGDGCPICLDERQYVPATGQTWTSWRELDGKHEMTLEPDQSDSRIIRIRTQPKIGLIGQTPFLIQTYKGSLIWDCGPYLSPSAVKSILSSTSPSKPLLGIAISHPHFFSSSVTWARKLGCKVYICAADKEWFMRKDSFVDESVEFWEGKTIHFGTGLTMIKCGGHFPGSCVLYWNRSVESSTDSTLPRTGVVFCSDTFKIAADRRMMIFLWSYVNFIPLPPKDIQNICLSLRPFEFEDIYSAWGEITFGDGKGKLFRSAKRFIEMEGWDGDDFIPDD